MKITIKFIAILICLTLLTVVTYGFLSLELEISNNYVTDSISILIYIEVVTVILLILYKIINYTDDDI